MQLGSVDGVVVVDVMLGSLDGVVLDNCLGPTLGSVVGILLGLFYVARNKSGNLGRFYRWGFARSF